MKSPNVILIICDQLRADVLGAYGNPHIYTPNIDFLAAAGTRFDHAYSAVPSCIPARATLWTGLNQWHAGILGMGWGQSHMRDDYAHTLAGELTGAGYRTHMVGKGHFHPQRALMGFETTELDESGRMPSSEHRQWFAAHAPDGVTPDDHGVDWNSWHARPWHTDEHVHPTAWTMSRALDFLRDQEADDRPFFLNISFARPHSPYVPPAHYFDMYANAELPEPHIGDWAAMHDDPETAANPNAWRGRMTPAQIRRARAGYHGSVSFIDTQIGRLLNLRGTKQGRPAADSWIILVSDHGDMQGDHNLWRKTYAYEGSARIPFLVVPPLNGDRPQRAAADEVVELRDIMPTILEVAGCPAPEPLDGCSTLPLLREAASDWRPYIHGEHCRCYHEAQEMQYVTDGKRKFIWLPRIGVEQFFDLEADPGELHDLVDDPARQDEVSTWRNYLVSELAGRDCGWVRGGQLHCPPDTPLVSPYLEEDWPGTEA